MPKATLVEVWDAIASQLQSVLVPTVDPDLQIVSLMGINVTPPAIDIYPDPDIDPFMERSGFGDADWTIHLTVRARVSPVDTDGQQELLLGMMDPTASTSVLKALNANKTLDGKVQEIVCDPPAGFAAYTEPGSVPPKTLIGCTWKARVEL